MVEVNAPLAVLSVRVLFRRETSCPPLLPVKSPVALNSMVESEAVIFAPSPSASSC
jgi:hypothetical protein